MNEDLLNLHRREVEAKKRVMQQIEDLKESAFWFFIFSAGFLMGAWLL